MNAGFVCPILYSDPLSSLMLPTSPLSRHVIRRVEIYVVALTAAFVAMAGAMSWWDVPVAAAILATALGIALIHGLIAWANSHRERALRSQVIVEVREMLRDQVLNQLAAMKMWVSEKPDPETIRLLFADVDESIDEVAALIDRLTEEQLDTWRLTYANASVHMEQSAEQMAAA